MRPLSLPDLTKERLQELYEKESKSVIKIAKELKSNPKTISRYLKRFGIQSRPFSTRGIKTRLGAVLSKRTKEKIRKKHLGKKLSPEHREKVIRTLVTGSTGAANPAWKGGITPANKAYWNRLRGSHEVKLWRKAVLERDRYMCTWCGSKKKLHADHIKPFAQYPELRTSITNGRTLCIECHRKTDTFGHKSRKPN